MLSAPVLLFVVAAPASAVGWGPLSSYYNGDKVVSSSGSAWKDGATAYNKITLTDSKNDGNTVYAKTRWWFCFLDCDPFGTRTTPEIENSTRVYTHSKNGMNRVETWSCAQMGWPVPDSCSNHATLDI